jgi:hypothetical protein
VVVRVVRQEDAFGYAVLPACAPQIMDRLLTGRMCFASISLGLAKLSVAAAVKYSENRRGFGLEPESPFVVMSYGSQMRSLIPRLAQVFAMQAGLGTTTAGAALPRGVLCN